MRKIYAFLAAALISVCAFASKDVVPSDEVIKDACNYEAGQVCACIYVPGEMACNDIIFAGTYNNWAKGSGKVEDAANCKKFEPIEDYDGWYVVAVDDESASPEGKPLLLTPEGKFSWQYQIGAATKIRGGVTVVKGAYEGEIDLKTYGKDAPNVYTVDAWKVNPCDAVFHNYKIIVINDGCGGYAWPYVVGDMTNWAFTQMQIDVDKSVEYQAAVYTYAFKAAEGTPYQLASGLMDEEGNIVVTPGWNDASYLQKLDVETGKWHRMPGESGDNLLTKEASEILFDLRDDTLRWARCDDAPVEEVLVQLKAPEGAPEAIEIIGSFGEGWEVGTEMTLKDGLWEAVVSAKETNVFKFRQKGTWDNQILYLDEEDDKWLSFGDGNDELVFGDLWTGESGSKAILLDFSDPELYKWSNTIEPEDPILIVVRAKLPAGAPEEVEMVGNFGGDETWHTGIILELEDDVYTTEVETEPSKVFKFRQKGGWTNQIQAFDGEAWIDLDNIVFKDFVEEVAGQNVVEIDFSNAELYKWTLTDPQGIESVVLTEKAQKIVVDGVLYIIRDNKMFNVQGTQVR